MKEKGQHRDGSRLCETGGKRGSQTELKSLSKGRVSKGSQVEFSAKIMKKLPLCSALTLKLKNKKKGKKEHAPALSSRNLALNLISEKNWDLFEVKC